MASERLSLVDMSTQHSSDCAAFITLASKALPRFVVDEFNIISREI